jgi:hypothetical protein
VSTFANPSTDVQNAVYTAAANYGIDPSWLFAIGNNETGLNGVNPATGGAGEIGTFQILPSTATGLGYSLDPSSPNYVGTLQNNANAAAANIAQIQAGGGTDISNILAQYNEGAGNIQKYGIVASTQEYIQNALAGIQNYSQNPPTIGGSSSSGGTNISKSLNPFDPGYWTSSGGPLTLGSNNQATTGSTNPVEQWIGQLVSNIETNILLGGLALALVAGGFALLAADNKQVQQAVKTAGKVAAAA